MVTGHREYSSGLRAPSIPVNQKNCLFSVFSSFSTWYCANSMFMLKLIQSWFSELQTAHSPEWPTARRDGKMSHAAWKNVSPLMCSHVLPLEEKKSFFWAVWRFVPSSALSGGISLILSMVCRNTGWGVSALVVVILKVYNTEGDKNEARWRSHVGCNILFESFVPRRRSYHTNDLLTLYNTAH